MKLEDELSSIEIFTSNIENPVIKQRVYQVLSWNIIKSTRYKRMFYILSILVLILNASYKSNRKIPYSCHYNS